MSTTGFFADISQSIGRTPLVKLNRVTAGAGAIVLGKIEGRNPSFSVKCRIGAAMIWDAEERGLLKPGMTIIEPTSGNTGIALASVGAARGHRVVLTMPESTTVEKRKLLFGLGAQIVLTSARSGMIGAIARARDMVKANPQGYFMPQQFNNPANPAIHEQTTGPEIWEATDGQIDVLVCGVGTGGTITGISRYIKRRQGRSILTVAVEPTESPVLTQHLAGAELRPGLHHIQGIGAGFIPMVLDLGLLDRVEQVDSAMALRMTRRLIREEGLLCGISSGAAVAVAVRLATQAEFRDKLIVTILPDLADRYLSTRLFANQTGRRSVRRRAIRRKPHAKIGQEKANPSVAM